MILRHAEREAIAAGNVGDAALLTESGMRAAREFGRALQGPILSIRTSPIQRCVQTAQCIAQAYGLALDTLQPTSFLGDPGVFIEDAQAAWRHWQRKGSRAVNRHLLRDAQAWSGFRDFAESMRRVRHEITTTLADGPAGTHVWVTHDTVLAPMVSRLLPEPLTLAQWPEFLGYAEICADAQTEASATQATFHASGDGWRIDRLRLTKSMCSRV